MAFIHGTVYTWHFSSKVIKKILCHGIAKFKFPFFCCFSSTQFINQLLGVIPLSAPSEGRLALPATIKALQQHLCVVQLTRLLGLYHAMDKAQKLGAVQDLMLRYRHGLEFGEKALEPPLSCGLYQRSWIMIIVLHCCFRRNINKSSVMFMRTRPEAVAGTSW